MEFYDQDLLVTKIRTATDDVFSTMLGIPVTPGEAFSAQHEADSFDGVVALAGLTGTWVGSARIACSAELACKLAGAMLASDYPAVNEDVLDAVSELTNMIVGNVKSSLEDELGPMGLGIPTVIYGRNYRARSCGISEWVVVPFDCEAERLEIKMALMPNGTAATARTTGVQEARQQHV
jgi:chemotaxis protein CheX